MLGFREHDGSMETGHGLAHRKVLLPFEAEICNQLGISEKEYFEFLAEAESLPVSREGYEHIPDVRNEISTTTLAIIQIVVGLALTAASALLAQKPRQKDSEPTRIQKEDNIGRQRFTPSSNFGSVQELARMGATVPLIFANRRGSTGYGGCRANALLTHSCLSSLTDSQRIKAIAVTSLAEIGQRPDYEGLAIGDQLLQDFNSHKVKAYYSEEEGVVREINDYEETSLEVDLGGDLTRMWWHPLGGYERVFAGTRTPGSKTEFGMYAPMPNANTWKLDFQMVVLPDSSKDSDRVRGLRRLIESDFPLCASVHDIDGDKATYRMLARNEPSFWERYVDEPNGNTTDGIANQINQQRYFIDSNINEGELYAFGNRLAVCIRRPTESFEPGEENMDYEFRLLDDGTTELEVRRNPDNTNVMIDHWRGEAHQLQRFQDAVVANNQTCDCTEIGIGSTVWKRLAGANINNFPGESMITDLEDDDGSGYDMGRMDVYTTRYSMFTLQIKPEGESTWQTARPIFCVMGNRPVEQFNAIRIYHTRGQHEYRLRPFPSNLAYTQAKNNDKPIYLLKSRKGLDAKNDNVDWYVHTDGFLVYFEGRQIFFNDTNARNPEAYKGKRQAGSSTIVTGFSASSYTPKDIEDTVWIKDPTSNNPRYVGDAGEPDPYNSKVIRRERYNENREIWAFFWDGEKVGGLETTLDAPFHGTDRYLYVSNTERYRPVDRQETWNQDANGVARAFFKIQREVQRTLDREKDGPKVRTECDTVTGRGSGLTVDLQKYTDGSYEWTMVNNGRNYANNDTVKISIPGDDIRFQVYVRTETDIARDDPGWWDNGDMYPFHAVTDYRNHDTEDASNINGPEHRVTYVNELIDAPDELVRGTYRDLASMAVIINSSRDLNQLNQLSAYYREGIIGRQFVSGSDTQGPIATLPEIAYFLLTNRVTGAGAVIDEAQIDLDSFRRATEFCKANDFYWDGVLSERVNLREWIYEQASYCMLDFTMKGGRFGLEPAVPVSSSGVVLTEGDAIPEVRGLFTDGNIRSMQVTTLTPEDRKLFEAEVLWRRERENHFPETLTSNVRLENYTTQSVETYDFTQFCTSRRQTVMFAKYALMVRKCIDHSIEFETTPESVAGIEPGDYIRVVSHVCHPSRFINGHVTPTGEVVASREVTNGMPIYYWRPGFTLDANTNSYIRQGDLRFKPDGTADDAIRGCVFSARNEVSTNRVYKVDSLSIGEEGFVKVTGAHMPLADNGALEIMQGWDGDEGFVLNDNEF